MDAHEQRLNAVAVVLYQPQDIVNVAAIIRVMSNFGLSDLRLVEPAAFDAYRIAGIAHHTEELIARTRRFATLDEALAECGLVLGTSGRPRERERLVLNPRQAAPRMLDAAGSQRVAVLFGPEQDGLANEQLDRCHGVICIPTHPYNRSLNLGQAALVIAYELWMAATGEATVGAAEPGRLKESEAGAVSVPSAPVGDELATGAQRNALFAAVDHLLHTLYPRGSAARHEQALARLRTLLMRAQPSTDEAAALTNLLRHASRAASRNEGMG